MDQKQNERKQIQSVQVSLFLFFLFQVLWEMRDGEYVSFLMFVAVNLSFHSQFKKDSRRWDFRITPY